jgi:hypothetical protein
MPDAILRRKKSSLPVAKCPELKSAGLISEYPLQAGVNRSGCRCDKSDQRAGCPQDVLKKPRPGSQRFFADVLTNWQAIQ